MTRDELADRAADRLEAAATAILALVSALAVLAAGLGATLLVRADTGAQRWAAGYVIGAGIGGWLSVLLPCLAAQALARYIQSQVGE